MKKSSYNFLMSLLNSNVNWSKSILEKIIRLVLHHSGEVLPGLASKDS